MPNVEKISIALPREMTTDLKKAVASGSYASASEVVREALRDWKEKQNQKMVAIQELRRLWKEGIDSGPGQYSSMDEIKAAARSDFELRQKQV